MKKWSNFFILTTLLPQLAMAVECKWWQTEVKSHDVIRHERNGTDVKSYHRQEHCREKWPGGDIFAPNLMNDKPLDWPHKEVFKNWKDGDAKVLIQVLGEMPRWMELSNFKYYRSVKSIFKTNPASSLNKERYILLYDSFFISTNKREIMAHEFSHISSKLSPNELEDFAILSGWTYKIEKDKVYELPPKKLIQKDSFTDKEEDFANYFGLFIEKPEFVKQYNLKVYEFLTKRYGK